MDKHDLRGANDLDLVYSGLDSIMSDALDETIQTAKRENCNLRIAAYLNAIKRIHVHYEMLGFTL